MARPFSVFGAIPIDAPPTRTLCCGWSGLGKKLAPQGETCEAWRAESSRPTSVMVREGRAGQETRPYKVISVMRDMPATAAMKPRLSL